MGERTVIRTVAGNEVRIERKGTSPFVDLEVWDPAMDDGPLVAVRLNVSDLRKLEKLIADIHADWLAEQAQRRFEMEQRQRDFSPGPEEIRRLGLSDG